MTGRAALLSLAAVLASTAAARADTPHDPPCRDCAVDAPRARRALLVVLHGDDAGASSMVADWRGATRAAHLALFAPQCPRELGCDGSWWRWLASGRYDEQWLAQQIAAVRSSLGVERVYLAGFSGGATYLSAWAPAHARDFKAVAFVSGGAAMTDACPSAAQAALLMIGGDDDMLEPYVRPFATWFASCKDATTTWRVVPQLGHHEMHRALAEGRAAQAIEWLLGTDPPPQIIDAPIAWNDTRARLTLAYRRAHSDPDADDLAITPRVIVLHYTDGDSASATMSYFDQVEIEAARAELKRAGAVNVSAHFLVDRDGTIYQLQPPTRFARHTIGLNHLAIGVENVGDDRKWPLTDAQVAADAALVRELARRYPITHLLGHAEVEHFRDNPYYVERDPTYRNSKPDPGAAFLARVRTAVCDLHLAGLTAATDDTCPAAK